MFHLPARAVRLAVIGATLGLVLLGAVATPTAWAGPTLPVPDTLWQPAAGSTPASGNYVFLDSDAGEWVGAGLEYLYTQADAVLGVTTSGGRLMVDVNGDESWDGDFVAMSPLTSLEPGYYPGLERYPFHDPAVGGLNWSGEGRGNNTLTGWFAVDEVTYSGGALASIHLRFEQRSSSGGPALHGVIHWTAGDPTQPAGPVLPFRTRCGSRPPGRSRRPATTSTSTATPATGWEPGRSTCTRGPTPSSPRRRSGTASACR